MKTIITIHPIDRPLQERIGIWTDNHVASVSVGRVLHQLIEAGYTELNSFVESRDYHEVHRQLKTHDDPDRLETVLIIHTQKK